MYLQKIINSRSLIESLKVGLACFIGYIFQYFAKLPDGELIVFTILLVIINNEHFGSLLKKSYLRLAGTIVGAIIAMIGILLLGKNIIASSVIVFISCVFFAFFSEKKSHLKYISILGELTVIFILDSKEPLHYAIIIRLLDVSIGICIALLVFRLIAPSHAIKNIFNRISTTLTNLKKLYEMNLINPIAAHNHDVYKLEKYLLRSLALQDRMVNESLLESKKNRLNSLHFEKILRTERGIFRSILFINRFTLFKNLALADLFSSPEIIEFNQLIINALEVLSKDLLSKSINIKPLQLSINNLEQYLLSQVQFFNADQVFLMTFLGSCQYLCHEIENLSSLLTEWNSGEIHNGIDNTFGYLQKRSQLLPNH